MSASEKELQAVLDALSSSSTSQKKRNQVAGQLKGMIDQHHELAQLQIENADMLMQVAKVSGLIVGEVWLHEANKKRTKKLETGSVLKLVAS